jgi:heme-degrading monooxygenase HmoA
VLIHSQAGVIQLWGIGSCWLRAVSEEENVFVAVYWWRVHPGKEEQFRKAWHRGTELITQIYGSCGSRLHRDRDGRFVGYAEWPDEATWRAAFDRKMAYDEPETRTAFLDAVAETPIDADPIFTMTVIDDLLVLRS